MPETELVQKTVRLVSLSNKDAQNASDDMERIFERYGVSKADANNLWKACQALATYLLLTNGELPRGDEGPDLSLAKWN